MPDTKQNGPVVVLGGDNGRTTKYPLAKALNVHSTTQQAKIKKASIEELSIQGVAILAFLGEIFKGVLYFNATKLAKQFGKDVRKYQKNSSTQEYISALMQILIEPNSTQLELHLIRKSPGRYGGTWFYHDLAMDFCRWLSPAFAVAMDHWTRTRLNEELERKREREKARLDSPEMTLALKAGYEESHEGKPTPHYIFSNENNLILRIVTGKSAKDWRAEKGFKSSDPLRDTFPAETMFWIARLQNIDIGLIQGGMAYQGRKAILSRSYLVGSAQKKLMVGAA